MEIIHENEYLYKMNDEIEPYLATHRQEGYISGAEDHPVSYTHLTLPTNSLV